MRTPASGPPALVGLSSSDRPPVEPAASFWLEDIDFLPALEVPILYRRTAAGASGSMVCGDPESIRGASVRRVGELGGYAVNPPSPCDPAGLLESIWSWPARKRPGSLGQRASRGRLSASLWLSWLYSGVPPALARPMARTP